MPLGLVSRRDAAAVACALVFVGLGVYFFLVPYPLSVDVAVDDALDALTSDGRHQWGNAPTELALDYTVIALADAALLVAAWRLAQPLLAAGLAASIVTQEIVVRVTKGLVGKVRPEGAFSETGAYPSGHTANVALTLMLFLWVVFPLIRRKPPTPRDIAYAVALAFVYAFFRASSGEHWISDVIGAVALAGAWALWTARVVQPWTRPAPPRR